MTPEELEKQPLAGGVAPEEVAAEEAVEVVEEAEAVEEEAEAVEEEASEEVAK